MGKAREKKRVLNAGMNAANIGPDLRYKASEDFASISFGIIRHLRASIFLDIFLRKHCSRA